MPDTGQWHAAVSLASIGPGRSRAINVAGVAVLVCRSGDEVFAIADFCTHDRKPIGDGKVRNGCVECPRHGARFAVRDGSVQTGPALSPTASYAVRVVEGTVEVLLTEGSAVIR